ncbi:uncharacterized protein LOC126315461, partial [Schistocerca gregaria]|uniref:uncharacterized protein LOC126315461 n=1 Tax=Schistocerca gregaria TaxID=7010 RepID=UPI00211F090D
MDVTPSVPVADSSPALPVISLPVDVAAPVPDTQAVDKIELPIMSDPVPADVTLSVLEPVSEAAPTVVNENVSAAAVVVVDREVRLDAPAEPKPRRERPTERAENVPRIRSASISSVSSRKARTPSPVVTCVPPYKSTSKLKKLQRASQRAVVDSRQAPASERRRQRPAACSQPEASVSSAESKRDEKVRQLKVLLTKTEPVVASGMAMDVVQGVSPANLAAKRKSDDSHCRRIRPHSQDSGSVSAVGAGPATAAPSGAAVSMDTEVVQPPVFSGDKCDWAADVEVDDGTGADGQDEVTWASVALGASPARASRVSAPELATDFVAMDVTPSVPVADSSPTLPVISLPVDVAATVPDTQAVDRIELPIVSDPVPAAVTLSVSEPVSEAAPSVMNENVSASATVAVDREERLDAPAEPKPRRERPTERAENVTRFRSASISGVSFRKARTPSPVVTCVPPYKSTSKQKKLQRASQRAVVDSRQAPASDRRRQRPVACSQPEASVSSAESKRDEKVRQLKVLLTKKEPVVASGMAMDVVQGVSPAHLAAKRKSDDSHCRRIRPHSQDSGPVSAVGAGPATAAPSGAAVSMDTEVVQPPVFSGDKCDWAADVEVDDGTGAAAILRIVAPAGAVWATLSVLCGDYRPETSGSTAYHILTGGQFGATSPPPCFLHLSERRAAPVPDTQAVDKIELPIMSDPVPADVTLSVLEPVSEAAPTVVNENVSAAAVVAVDREERLDAPAEPKPRRERPTERAENVPRIRSASISGVSSRKARTPSPVVTCVPPYKSTSKLKKLQRASQRAVVDSRQAPASERRRQRPAACSQPEASVSSAESKRDEKVRQLKVLLTKTEPVVASGMAMDVVQGVSPAHLAAKRKSDDSHCRRIRPHSQDSGSVSAVGAGPATAAPFGAAVSMDTEVVQPPVFSGDKCDWAADVEVDDGTGAVILRIVAPAGAVWATLSVLCGDYRPETSGSTAYRALTGGQFGATSPPPCFLHLSEQRAAPVPDTQAVDKIELPIMSDPVPADVTLSVLEPVSEAAPTVVNENVSAAAVVAVDREERLDAPAEPKPRRERPTERAENVPRIRSASISGVSSRKARTPSPVVTCVPPYKSTSKLKKLQRASQRAVVDSRQAPASERRRQRPAACSQPEASVSSAESKRDEKVRQLKVLLTKTEPVVASGMAMDVVQGVSPAHLAAKRKSDDSHCRRIRPHSQDSGSVSAVGAGPATAAPFGAAVSMDTEVVQPPVFSGDKCDWAADVEVDDGTGAVILRIVAPAGAVWATLSVLCGDYRPETSGSTAYRALTGGQFGATSPPPCFLHLSEQRAAPVPDTQAVDKIELPIMSDPVPADVTLSVLEPVSEAAPTVVNENVSAAAVVVVDREVRLDAPAEPKPRRERPTERAENVPRIRSASISSVSSRKARTPSPVVTCVPPYKSTSKLKKLQRASQRAVVDSRQAPASERRRQRPAACSQPEASVSSAESKRDEKVRQLKVLLTKTEPVVASGMAMDVVQGVSPANLAAKRKSDDSHCRRIRPHSQDSGSVSAVGAGPATAAPSGAAVSMDTEVVQPPVFSGDKCDWAADVEVDDGTGA